MKPSTIARKLTDLGFALLQENLALDAKAHISSAVGRDRYRISWVRDDNLGGSLISSSPFMIAEYIQTLRDHEYSYLLSDGGLIQISIELTRGEVSKHRLAYYPCPFDLKGELDTITEFGLIDYIEEICIPDAVERIRMRTPLRFDFAPSDATDYHPASHLTMIDEECRIPVRTPLLFEHFVKFIFENFYFSVWAHSSKLFGSLVYGRLDECASTHDISRLHFSGFPKQPRS